MVHAGAWGALVLLVALSFGWILTIAETGLSQPKPSEVGLPPGLVAADAQVSVAASVCFLEGPAFDGEGNLFFSDIAGNRILKMNPAGRVSVFREDSGRTNGNTFDAQGRLLSCEGAEFGSAEGRRRIVRTDLQTGKIEVLTDRYEGKRYNSPNDICVDVHGRIWFTDPYYGPDRHILEMGHEAVYRIDPDGKVTRVLTQPAIQRPNGIAITPDAKILYVVDSHPAPGGNRKIWAFTVQADGSLSNQRLVYDFGRGRGGDGMRLDMQGNLWVCAGVLRPRGPGETAEVPPGVYVISPQGKLLGRIPIPEDLITNLAFGGPERKTLFVTAGKTVYRIPVNVSGYALYPPLR
ncbi:Gluconolactonase [bacterium HR36]|nr:Gluconolactonase [bacterium HR36]